MEGNGLSHDLGTVLLVVLVVWCSWHLARSPWWRQARTGRSEARRVAHRAAAWDDIRREAKR